MKVEQMRKAILEGIKMDVFAKPPFSMIPGAPQFPGSVYPPGNILTPAKVVNAKTNPMFCNCLLLAISCFTFVTGIF